MASFALFDWVADLFARLGGTQARFSRANQVLRNRLQEAQISPEVREELFKRYEEALTLASRITHNARPAMVGLATV